MAELTEWENEWVMEDGRSVSGDGLRAGRFCRR